MNPLAEQIEAFLLSERGWVSASLLCERFNVRERALRGISGKPGLCSTFAISGDKGYKHVARATEREFERFRSRLREHAIAQMVRARRLRRLRDQLRQQLLDL